MATIFEDRLGEAGLSPIPAATQAEIDANRAATRSNKAEIDENAAAIQMLEDAPAPEPVAGGSGTVLDIVEQYISFRLASTPLVGLGVNPSGFISAEDIGVEYPAGTRVWLDNFQGDQTRTGLWELQVGAWTRPDDWVLNDKIVPGTMIPIARRYRYNAGSIQNTPFSIDTAPAVDLRVPYRARENTQLGTYSRFAIDDNQFWQIQILVGTKVISATWDAPRTLRDRSQTNNAFAVNGETITGALRAKYDVLNYEYYDAAGTKRELELLVGWTSAGRIVLASGGTGFPVATARFQLRRRNQADRTTGLGWWMVNLRGVAANNFNAADVGTALLADKSNWLLTQVSRAGS